jgi:hypothetical protein
MNLYSYVEDNPLRYTDPNGRAIYENATPAVFQNSPFNHEFYYVIPENPNAVHISGVPAGATSFTIGGFPSGFNGNPIAPLGDLVVNYGYEGHPTSDWNAVTSDPGALGVLKTRGQAVSIDYKNSGYSTEAQLINAMGSAANAASGGNLYGPFGSLGSSIYCNSNCFNQNIAYRTGILDQIAAFKPPAYTYTPGAGTKILPSPGGGGGGSSVSSAQYSALIYLANAFTPTSQSQFSALQGVVSAFGGIH